MLVKPADPMSSGQAHARSEPRKISLAYLVSHPIQYQAPLLRLVAAVPEIDLTVFFASDHSVRSYHDAGFGQAIKWDVPLLDGYRHEFLGSAQSDGSIKPDAAARRQFAARLRSRRFDVLWVHGFTGRDNLRFMASAWRAGTPVLVRDEATAISRQRSIVRALGKRVFFRILGQLCRAFLAIGSLNREYYLANGIPRERIFMVPYAVDNDYFARLGEKAAERREALRFELGLEPGRPIILFASKFEPRKRAADLLAAFEWLRERQRLPARPYLMFVGDGETRAEIESRAQGLGGDVRFLGFRNQSELPGFYQLCDVFVLPSVQEPWGLVINEVMNVGRPVIVTDQAGCGPDLVHDGVNGYILPPDSPSALALALENVLADPQRTAAMGRSSADIIATWSFAQDIEGLKAAILAVTSVRHSDPTR
jgi:glycosyltransferase involved in cell wall biosynthesis